jgi:hypothetical protein
VNGNPFCNIESSLGNFIINIMQCFELTDDNAWFCWIFSVTDCKPEDLCLLVMPKIGRKFIIISENSIIIIFRDNFETIV